MTNLPQGAIPLALRQKKEPVRWLWRKTLAAMVFWSLVGWALAYAAIKTGLSYV